MRNSGSEVQRLKELAESAQFRPGRLARMLKVNQRQLHRQFLRTFGCSPRQWLDEVKLEIAEARLGCGELAKNIAPDLHFQHVTNFCRWYHARRSVSTGAKDQIPYQSV